MSCQQWREAILSFFDDRLPGEVEGKLRAHLHGCAACQGEFQLQERIDSYFVGRPSMEPSGDFTARALARAKAWEARKKLQFEWPVWMDYAVGAALALVIVAFLWPSLVTLTTPAGDRIVELGGDIQAVEVAFLQTLLSPYSEQFPFTPLSVICMGAVFFFASLKTYRALRGHNTNLL